MFKIYMLKKTTLLLLYLYSLSLVGKAQDLTKKWAKLLPSEASIVAQTIDHDDNLILLTHFNDGISFNANNTASGEGTGIVKYDKEGNFLWSKFYGDSTTSLFVSDIAADTSGNIYLLGDYKNTVDLDPNSGTIEVTADGDYRDIALVKLDGTGTLLSQVTFGGKGAEKGEKLFVNISGKVVLTGSFDGYLQSGLDFNPDESEVDSLQSTNPLGDGSDHFILRLNNDLTYDWVYQFNTGNGGMFSVNDIATDNLGDVFVCGDTDEWFRTAFVDSDTVGYVMKLSDQGVSKWKKRPFFYHSPKTGAINYYTESIQSIDVSKTGDVYLSGYYELDTIYISLGADTINVDQFYDNASKEIFVSKFQGSNGGQAWFKRIEASGDNYANSISVNQNGNLYVFGEIHGSVSIDDVNLEPGAFVIEVSTRRGTILKKEQLDVISIDYANERKLDNGYYLTGLLNTSSSILGLDGTEGTSYISSFQFNYSSDTTIWNGDAWSNGKPTIDKPAIIDGIYRTSINGNLIASSLVVTSKAQLDVGYYYSYRNRSLVEVDGEIKNHGVIQVGINSVLLHDSYEGNGSFYQFVYPGWGAGYKFISSPVQNHVLLPSLSSSSRSLFYDVGSSLEVKADNWKHVTDSTLTMQQGQGFAIWKGGYISFRGKPNSGEIVVPLEYVNEDGNNLIGNPYPSPISGEQLLLDNPKISALYFWLDDYSEGEDYSSNDYVTWNLSGVNIRGHDLSSSLRNISVGQGFFVQVDTIDQEITFLNSQRQSITESLLRKRSLNGRLWLKFEGEQKQREILIASMDWATEGFDQGWDALDFSSKSNNFLFATLDKEHQPLSIQALPTQEEYLIPLYLRNYVGEGEINISDIEGFDDYEVKLLDHKKGTTWILSQNGYKFEAEEGEEERFSLSIEPKNSEVLSLKNTLEDEIAIGSTDNGVNVISAITANLTIFNTSGQVIDVLEVPQGELFIPTKKGEILLFQFNTDKASFTKKVIR